MSILFLDISHKFQGYQDAATMLFFFYQILKKKLVRKHKTIISKFVFEIECSHQNKVFSTVYFRKYISSKHKIEKYNENEIEEYKSLELSNPEKTKLIRKDEMKHNFMKQVEYEQMVFVLSCLLKVLVHSPNFQKNKFFFIQ